MSHFAGTLGVFAPLSPDTLRQPISLRAGTKADVQFVLYAMLRAEQAALVEAHRSTTLRETSRILGLAQQAYGDLRGLLVGRDDSLLDRRPQEGWTLRDLLRHVVAVELRYAAQVHYSAYRSEDEPVPIPPERLPCDRLSPPEPDFAETRRCGIPRWIGLLELARSRTDALLDGIPDERLLRPSLWGGVEMDVRGRMHQVAAHIAEHIVQCEQLLEGLDERDGEARRVVRRVSATRGGHERISPPDILQRLDTMYAGWAAQIVSESGR